METRIQTRMKHLLCIQNQLLSQTAPQEAKSMLRFASLQCQQLSIHATSVVFYFMEMQIFGLTFCIRVHSKTSLTKVKLLDMSMHASTNSMAILTVEIVYTLQDPFPKLCPILALFTQQQKCIEQVCSKSTRREQQSNLFKSPPPAISHTILSSLLRPFHSLNFGHHSQFTPWSIKWWERSLSGTHGDHHQIHCPKCSCLKKGCQHCPP